MFTLISTVIGRSGVGGVFLLMLVENLIPAIPSELILPFAGFEASRGAFNPLVTIVAATLGSVLGGIAWYEIGRRFGLERLKAMAAKGGRWVAVTPAEIESSHAWFKRYCGLAVCVGRALPGVRGLICIPAGIARMPFWRFLIWSGLGAAIWSSLLIGGGMLLGAHYVVVERWLNPVADGFLIFCVGVYIYRVLRPAHRVAKAP